MQFQDSLVNNLPSIMYEKHERYVINSVFLKLLSCYKTMLCYIMLLHFSLSLAPSLQNNMVLMNGFPIYCYINVYTRNLQ
jgi:hypothetical protein